MDKGSHFFAQKCGACHPGDGATKYDRDGQIYFDAVRSGLDRDYLPMQQVVGRIIAKTLRAYRSRSSSS